MTPCAGSLAVDLSGRLARFCTVVLLCFCMSGGLSLSSLSLAFAQDVRPRTQSPATEPQTPGDSQLPGAAPSPEKKPAEDAEQTAAKKDDKEKKHHRGALVVAYRSSALQSDLESFRWLATFSLFRKRTKSRRLPSSALPASSPTMAAEVLLWAPTFI